MHCGKLHWVAGGAKRPKMMVGGVRRLWEHSASMTKYIIGSGPRRQGNALCGGPTEWALYKVWNKYQNYKLLRNRERVKICVF